MKINPNILIISDYGKGMITSPLMSELTKKFHGKIIVDPKPKNINLYKNIYLLKPNLKEASEILGYEVSNKDKNIEQAIKKISNKYNCNVVITRAERGSTLYIRKENRIIHIPTKAKVVHDVLGAGDTFIATIAYGLKRGYSLEKSVKLANKASSIVVGKLGTATIKKEQLIK